MPRKAPLDEGTRIPPDVRTKWVKTIVADVASQGICRWQGEIGVLSRWSKGGRRFESWEGPTVKLWPHEEIEVLARSERNSHQAKEIPINKRNVR